MWTAAKATSVVTTLEPCGDGDASRSGHVKTFEHMRTEWHMAGALDLRVLFVLTGMYLFRCYG
jgi:hypothetical protein